MQMMKTTTCLVSIGFVLSCGDLFPSLQAAPLDLVTVQESSKLYPNVMLVIDDSASMKNHKQPTNYVLPTLSSYFKENELMYQVSDWRQYLPAANTLHYDSKKQYKPWFGKNDAVVSPEAFKAINEWYKYADTSQPGFTLNFWEDTASIEEFKSTSSGGYSYGSGLKSNIYYNYKLGPNGMIDYWDDHVMLRVSDEGTFSLTKYTYSGTPANGQRFTVTESYPSYSEYFTRTQAAEAQNIVNWFTYHLTREHKLKFAVSELIRNYPKFYYGLFGLNSKSLFLPIRDLDNTGIDSFNQQLLNKIYRYESTLNTPTMEALMWIGNYFKNGNTLDGTTYPSPLKSACQANINFVITDGTHDLHNDHGLGDVDGDGSNFKNIADITRYFYINDLAPDLPNLVPNYEMRCPAIEHVNHQSLSTHFLTLGVTTSLTPDPEHCWPSTHLGTSDNWGSNLVDQSWHAAYNSRGSFQSSMDFDEIFDILDASFGNLTNEIVFSSNTSVSSYLVGPGNTVYYAKANVAQNQGYLVAEQLGSDNQFSELWEAGNQLSQNTARRIWSYNTSTK